jgi:hypothetical protein
VKTTRLTLFVALVSSLLLACPEAPKPPPPVVVQPTPPPVEPPPAEPPPPEEPPPLPPKPALSLNEPSPSADGGVLPEEAMPPWSKVEVGDYVVYDIEGTRPDTADVFRLAGGPAVSARVKLQALAVDKTGVTVEVKYVPNGPNATAPRWLEPGMVVKMALGAPRPKGQPVAESGLLFLQPKTPLSAVEHAGKSYRCRFHRVESANPDGTPSRKCVGSPDRTLILGSGTVYAQGIKNADGNALTLVLVEAGKVAPAGTPGPLGFEDGVPLVTRRTSPAGELLSFLKLTAAGGTVKTEDTVHTRAATGQAAAMTYDGANWLKPQVAKTSQELLEWVASRFTDDGLFTLLPEGGNPGASVVYGPTRIDTLTVGIEVPATDTAPARTFRWLVPARPTAIKTAPVWIRFGSIELTVHEGDKSWKRRVVTFSK